MDYWLTALVLAWIRWRVELGMAATAAMVLAVVLLVLAALTPVDAAGEAMTLGTELARLAWGTVLLIAVLAVRLHGIVSTPKGEGFAETPRRQRRTQPIGAMLSRAGRRLYRVLIQRLRQVEINELRGPPSPFLLPGTKYVPERPRAGSIDGRGGGPRLRTVVRRVYRVLVGRPRTWAWGLILMVMLVLALVRFELPWEKPVAHGRSTAHVQSVEAMPRERGSADGLLGRFRRDASSLSASELAAVEVHCDSQFSARPFAWQNLRDQFVLYRQSLPVVRLPSPSSCVVIVCLGMVALRAYRRSRLARRWRRERGRPKRPT